MASALELHPDAAPSGAAPTKPRILVVEDEEAIGRLVARYLESVGYEVRVVTRGADAVKDATDHRPQLVILDLRLPDLHGFDVCRELRQMYRPWSVPILMVTGCDTPFDKMRGYAHGADAYITKPFEPPELLPVVEFLLGKIDPSRDA